MNPRIAELEWYRKHGKYFERIAHDKSGNEYVIGDWSWNTAGRPREIIEPRMRAEMTRPET